MMVMIIVMMMMIMKVMVIMMMMMMKMVSREGRRKIEKCIVMTVKVAAMMIRCCYIYT